LLRGPQTVGELRGRSERLYTFDDLEGVESTLHRLAEMEFVKQLPRQPGFKEQRYAELLSGPIEVVAEVPVEAESAPASGRVSADRDRIAALEAGLAELRREFEEFRKSFE
jgi:hypothetical protein